MLPGPGHRVQAGGSALGGPFVEEIQNCVGHGHFRQASPAGRGGHRDMPQGELVNDHERDHFRSGQKASQRIRVAPERIRGAFAMREAAVRGCRCFQDR